MAVCDMSTIEIIDNDNGVSLEYVLSNHAHCVAKIVGTELVLLYIYFAE